MDLVFTVVSSVISIIGTVPYIRDTLRGKTKPRVVSWFTWTLLTGIASTVAFIEQAYPTSVLTICMTLGCLTITILSIVKNGTVSFERFDIVCQSLALTGLVLWWILGDPTIALVMAVVVDCIAALPTLRHAWKAPHEETLFNFLTAGIASVVTLCAIHSVSLVSVLYPLYLVIINLVTAGAIIFSGKRLTRSQRNEAERL